MNTYKIFMFNLRLQYTFNYIDALFRKLAELSNVEYVKSEIKENFSIIEKESFWSKKSKQIKKYNGDDYFIYVKSDDIEKIKILKIFSTVIFIMRYEIDDLVKNWHTYFLKGINAPIENNKYISIINEEKT